MQGDLDQVRQSVAAATALQKRLERQYHQTCATAQHFYRRAHVAIEHNNEKLARENLAHYRAQLELAQSLDAQIQQQQPLVSQLRQSMVRLEQKLIEVCAQRDLYFTRFHTARMSHQIQRSLEFSQSQAVATAFQHLETHIQNLEAEVEAIAELAAHRLDAQFAALEKPNPDADLEDLKAQVAQQHLSKPSFH
jgi:phage shock protein A